MLLVSACGESNPRIDGNGLGEEPEPVAPSDTDEPSTVPGIPTQAPEPETLVEPEPTAPGEPAPMPSAPAPEPCEITNCNPGQRCEVTAGAAACVDVTCEELACTGTEVCEPHELGGHTCVDIGCTEDVDCAPEEFCDTGASLCVPDVCVAEARSCSGNSVLECASSGSGESERFVCESPAYFTSMCQPGADATGCTCSDDWDCPAFTRCEVGLCIGTGTEPSCTLPPVPFADTPPTIEIHWGGDTSTSSEAHDGSPERNPAPWPEHSHVVSTPMVANLDDDNGDGLVNELDFPEIVFLAYEDGTSTAPGVVRAIHGGGPDKGKDLFAVCGTTVWHADAPSTAACSTPNIYGRDSIAVGDLDQDGVPEIVFPTADRAIQILDNRGQTLFISEPDLVEDNTQFGGAAPAIANMDFDGLPEIAIGRQVFTLALGDAAPTPPVVGDAGATPPAAAVAPTASGRYLYVEHVFVGSLTRGVQIMGPQSCIADLNTRAGQELLAGATLYGMPARTACASPPCRGDLDVVWDGTALNPDLPTAGGGGGMQGNAVVNEGFCAVADVWGADAAVAPGPDNPPDGRPEAVLIANGYLEIFDGESGTLILARDLAGGVDGGAPNIDDFDGDGFMEIGSSLESFYIMIDLQEPSDSCPDWPTPRPRDITGGDTNPNTALRDPGGACTSAADCNPGSVCNERLGTCVCLHNGWKRETDDDSSRVTSSSVFDFNGDGATEVMYNDECEFRMYDGLAGDVLYTAISRSRTAMENPVVADVDNDGNAEAITITNTENPEVRCIDDAPPEGMQGEVTAAGPNGLQVFGDPNDSWVSARRIWNQHAYHVTNVTESGAIPVQEAESWKPYNGRLYNTYRSQPRNYGVAPDLQVTAVGVSSPDVACGELGDQLVISFEITNAGDIRVGPGVEVSFYGVWDDMESVLLGPEGPLTYVIQSSIEPGRSLIDSVLFDIADQGADALPASVRVVVDTGGDAEFGLERECIEDNNENGAEVVAGDPRPDLSLDVGMAAVDCDLLVATVDVVVTNSGTAEATGVVVEIYFGDPSAGGTPVTRVAIPEPIPPGGSVTVTAMVDSFPLEREILLWGVVDPDDTVVECNEADNIDPADNDIICKLRPAGAR